MGRISTSYRYEIDIIGTDPFSLGELGGFKFGKIRKIEVFLTQERMTGSE